jgi:hypothetical protein
MIGLAQGLTPDGLVITGSPPPDFADAPVGTRVLTWRGQTNFASITDGTSNTLLIGEKHIRPSARDGMSEDRSVFSGNNANNYSRLAGLDPDGVTQRPLVQDPNDGTSPDANLRFGGPHPGVCQFVLCDGSVKAIKTTIDLTTLTRLALRDDGLPISASDF